MAIGNEEINKFMMQKIREHGYMLNFFNKLSEANDQITEDLIHLFFLDSECAANYSAGSPSRSDGGHPHVLPLIVI